MSYQRPAKPFSEPERDLTTVLFPAIIGAPERWEIIAIEFVDAGKSDDADTGNDRD